jgi:putative phage-type endonuclease
MTSIQRIQTHQNFSKSSSKPSLKNRPALRLVDTTTISRDEWLDVRKTGIGGSDAAAAVGLNPYKSQLELWLEKTGRECGLRQPDPSDDTHPTYWGVLLEPIVASAYTKRTGHRVRKINAVLQHPDPELHWMLANIDREVVGSSEVSILECKSAGINGAKSWRDGVPEYVQIQVQHQLAVTGKQAADVAVLICGQALEVHRIERDPVLIERLIALEARFWQYVTTDTPPPPDGTDSAAHALAVLYPMDGGSSADFTSHEDLNSAFERLIQVRAQLSSSQSEEAQLKQVIQAAMGEASQAKFATGQVSWKKAKDTRTLDTEALQREHAQLLAGYMVPKTGSRRFLIN